MSVRRVLVIALLISNCMTCMTTLSFHFLFCKRDVLLFFVVLFSSTVLFSTVRLRCGRVSNSVCFAPETRIWTALVWMFVSLQNSCVEILMPYVMVLGSGSFGWCLGHDGGALRNGISEFIKKASQRPLALSTMWGHSEKVPAVN